MLKKENIKDVLRKTVKVGDKVIVLTKFYTGFGISRASLKKCTYLGKGRWGYEFKDPTSRKGVWRLKMPEVVKI